MSQYKKSKMKSRNYSSFEECANKTRDEIQRCTVTNDGGIIMCESCARIKMYIVKHKKPTLGNIPAKIFSEMKARNEETLVFYQRLTMFVGAFYNVIYFFFFYDQMRLFIMLMNIIVMMVYIACHQVMRIISRPRFSKTYYNIIEPGINLNKPGPGEHMKDIVLIAVTTQLLALFSDMFWLALLVIPLKILWLTWYNVWRPRIFGPDEELYKEKAVQTV